MVDPRSFANAYRKSKSSSASSSQEPGQSPSNYLPLKVPIPRLRRSSVAAVEEGNSGSGGGSSDKHRVSHACEPCRQRKTKCSGERPTCKHCQDFKYGCYYADGKRDRAKNELIMLKKKIDVYESLLDRLKHQVDSAGQLAIQKALKVSEREPYHFSPKNRDGESLVSADVGSTGSADHIREDPSPTDNIFPTGYMGKNSEVAWIQRVAKQLAEEASKDHYLDGFPPTATSALAARDGEDYQFETPIYHLDDVSVTIAGGDTNPFFLPPKETADELLNAFFATVHPTFPIVLKSLFMDQYDTFFQCFFPGSFPGSSKKWLAMLNLMFAIGSMYGKLVGAEWKGESEVEHLKFFTRARILSLDESSMFEVPDLQQVQVMSLAGIYLIASNQTNRAWNVVGLAIRYAQTLGLNLRNDVPKFDEIEKEMRVRMWYTIYSLDHLLCTMTGRPACIQGKDCSVPMPRPVEQEHYTSEEAFANALKKYSETAIPPSPSSSSSKVTFASPAQPWGSPVDSSSPPSGGRNGHGSLTPFVPQYPAAYFIEHTKLNQIISEALSQLYRPAIRGRSWSDIQGTISALELKVMKWRAELPALLDFGRRHKGQIYCRQRVALAFQYQYTRIIINRPCLCRLGCRIPNESKRSRGFNRSAAATCVEAAREMIAILPDEPNPVGLVTVSPWWCLMHYLVSAGTVLIVEIAMRAEHNPQQADGLLKDSKKLVSWLRAMGKDNLAAERSWTVLSRLLIVAAPKIGGDTSDVARDFPPSNWRNGASKACSTNQGGPSHTPDLNHGGQIPPNAGPQVGNQPLEDFPDIFRGILADPFPYADLPMHAHFENPLATPQVPPHFLNPISNGGSFPSSHGVNSGPMVLQAAPTSLMFSTQEHLRPLNDGEEIVQKKHERRQRRKQSQGIGQISLPPPLTSQWASSSSPINPSSLLAPLHTQGSSEPFAMGSLAHTFRDSGHGSRAGTTYEGPISPSTAHHRHSQRGFDAGGPCEN